MSVFDEIEKLEKQRDALLAQAKDDALTKATEAVATLQRLGFNYKLIEEGASSTSIGGARRTGVRSDVLNAVKAAENGVSRADLLEAMSAKGDKRAEQSISNALANLKKSGQINLNDGIYTAGSD